MPITANVAEKTLQDEGQASKHQEELDQFIAPLRSRGDASCNDVGDSDTLSVTKLLVVGAAGLFVGVAVSVLGSSNRLASHNTDRSVKAATANDDASRTDAALAEIKAIERDVNRRLSQGHTDAPDLDARVDRLEHYAREKATAMNRRPFQSGYSLSTRKQAAVMTLIQQGYSRADAELAVDDMVRMNLLPDPPRR